MLLNLFAGAICDGLECAPLLLFVLFYKYKLWLVIGLIILGLAAMRFAKSAKVRSAAKVLTIIGIVLFGLVFTTSMNAQRKFNAEEQAKATNITYTVYKFSALPAFLKGKLDATFTSSLVKPSTGPGNYQVLEGAKYTRLIYSYGPAGSDIQVKQFNKSLYMNNTQCVPYDPEFPDKGRNTAPGVATAEDTCTKVGRNNFGGDIYKTVDLGSTVYITDVNNTRIVLDGFAVADLKDVPDSEVIELFNELEPVAVRDIRFKGH